MLLKKLTIIAGAAGLLLSAPVCLFAFSYESSLVGYWELDETSGSYAYDSTAYNRNGTISGATQGVPGVYGTAYSFDGSNDYVNFGTQILLSPSAFTFTAWIKPEAGMSGARLIAYNPSTNGATTKYFDIYLSGNVLVWDLFKTGNVWDGINTNVTLSEWNHIASVYTGTSCSLYLNGESVGSKSASLTAYTKAFNTYLGNNANNLSQGPFKGTMDDIAIWNRALDPYEIDSIYDLGVQNFEAISQGINDDMGFGFSTEELNQLADIYLNHTQTPVKIGDLNWRYLEILPGEEDHAIGDSWTTPDGKYYIKLGSGLEGSPEGTDVPEPSTLLILLPFIGFGLKRLRGRTGRGV